MVGVSGWPPAGVVVGLFVLSPRVARFGCPIASAAVLGRVRHGSHPGTHRHARPLPAPWVPSGAGGSGHRSARRHAGRPDVGCRHAAGAHGLDRHRRLHLVGVVARRAPRRRRGGRQPRPARERRRRSHCPRPSRPVRAFRLPPAARHRRLGARNWTGVRRPRGRRCRYAHQQPRKPGSVAPARCSNSCSTRPEPSPIWC